MRDYLIELEIFQGNGGQLRSDERHPNFAQEGVCAWMYGSHQVGQKFRYPEDLGQLCPWLVDSLTGVIRALEHGAVVGGHVPAVEPPGDPAPPLLQLPSLSGIHL